MNSLPDMPAEVTGAIAPYPEPARKAFHTIREVVLRAAATNPIVGPLTEATKSGTTLRIAWKPATPDHIVVFVNCRTSLVETMRSIYPDTFRYQGNRALLIALDASLPAEPLDHCARLAQTYHLKHEDTAKSA